LDNPAGNSVEQKPGSYHVMLMDLKAPLADKTSVPVTLMFENSKGVKSQIELQVPVKSMNMQSQHKH
jgi:copper(I)-binding protein